MIENNVDTIRRDLSCIAALPLDWEKFNDSNILVTGASGFIGFYLSTFFLLLNDWGLAENISVYCLVRNLEFAKIRFGNRLTDKNLVLINADLSQPSEGLPAVEFDYIFHAASQASPKFYKIDPVGTAMPNIIGTYNLLELFRRSSRHKRFCFISSSEIYGNNIDSSNLTESHYGSIDPLDPRSCYAESKKCAEMMCKSWSTQFDIETIIVRPFHTYGPGLKRNDGRVFADFAYNIYDNKDIVLNSDGSAIRSYCYISDLIAGIFYTIFNGAASLAYNIANPNATMSVLELAKLLISMYPEKSLNVRYNSNSNSNYLQSAHSILTPDITKISELGWRPCVSPKEGFARFIASLAQ